MAQDFYEGQQEVNNTQPSIDELYTQGIKQNALLADEYALQGYDPLMDRYPRFKPVIEEMYRQGKTREQIADFFSSQVMPRLNWVGNAQQVSQFLQQTPEGLQNLANYQHFRMMDAFRTAHPDKSDKDIYNAIEISSQTGLDTNNLLRYPDIYKGFIGDRKEREKWYESVYRGGKNYLTGNTRGEIGSKGIFGHLSREEVIKQAHEVEQQMIQQPAIVTPMNEFLAGTSAVLTQGFKNQWLKGMPLGATLGGIGATIGYPFGVSKQGAQFGFKAGMLIANAWELFEDQAGNDYIDLIQMKDEEGKPLDEDVARITAAITGAATIATEFGMMKWALNITPGGNILKKFMGLDKRAVIDSVVSDPVIRYTFKQIALDTAKGIGASTLNNIAEAVYTQGKFWLANQIGHQKLPLSPDYWQGVKNSMWDAAGTWKHFAGSALFSAAFRTPGMLRQLHQYNKGINTLAQQKGVNIAQAESEVASEIQTRQEAFNTELDKPETQQKLPQHDPFDALGEANKIIQEQIPPEVQKVQNAEYVFVPAEKLQSFLEQNIDADVQGVIDAGREIGIPREQFEQLKDESPEFFDDVSNNARYGADGVTPEDANRKMNVTDPVQATIFHSPEFQQAIQQQKQIYINSGESEQKADDLANLLGAVGAAVKARTGITISPLVIKTAEELQAQQAREGDMSRVQNREYNINDPNTWTDQNRAQRLFDAFNQSKLTNLELFIKNFLDRTTTEQEDSPQTQDQTQEQKDTGKVSATGILREELKDYSHTLRTANQKAVDALTASAWDAERYDVGSKMPRGKTRNPDSRYQYVDYDGRTDIDLAVDKNGDNLSVRVKNPKSKNPFVLTIKNFRQANLTQVIDDLAGNLKQKADWLLNAPIVKNIGLALADFWHEQGLEETAEPARSEIQTANIDSIERTQPSEIQIKGGEIKKPTVSVEGERIQKPTVNIEGGRIAQHSRTGTQIFQDETMGGYVQIHKGEIPNSLMIPAPKEMPNERADTLEAETETYVPDVQENLAEDQDYPNPDIPMVMSDNGMNALSEQRLERATRVWSDTALNIVTNPTRTAQSKTESYVMQAPLVLSLAGVDAQKIIGMKDSKIDATKDSILKKHQTITLQQVQDAPRKLADPIAILQSSPNSSNSNGRVVLTDMVDSNGASIIIALDPNHKAATKAIGVPDYVLFASMYPQAETRGKKKGQPDNQWFQNEVNAGRLLYVNTQKAAQWAQHTGVDLIPQGFDISTVKTEKDLQALWANPQNEGLYKIDPSTGEHLSSINVNAFGDIGRAIVQRLTAPTDTRNYAADVHDIGHDIGSIIEALAEDGNVQAQQDMEHFRERAGVTTEDYMAEKIGTKGGAREKVNEWIADAWEVYLSEGKAPTSRLQQIFERARQFLLDIYYSITEQLGITLNDKDREIFDRLLTMPASDNDTVTQFAEQNAHIDAEISRLQTQVNAISEQQQRDFDTLNVETSGQLNDQTIEAVEDYLERDPELRQAIGVSGNTVRVSTIKGTEVDTRYKIVDANELITSHNDKGDINPNFPLEIQPRDRGRSVSRQNIEKIIRHMKPEALGASWWASQGAPIIGSDNIVESGNGRVSAIRQAYQSGKADKYRQWLIDNAQQFGLSPDEINNVQQPVLVRERLTDVDRATFALEANESDIADMSLTERATSDATKLTNDMLALFDINSPLVQNKDFIRVFSQIVPENERGNFLQANGNISRSGLDRIVHALIAKAYGDSTLLNRLNESYDDNIRNISQALITAAPSMAVLNNSNHDEAILLQNEIVQAVNLFSQLKQEGTDINSWLNQPSLFEDADVSQEVKNLLQFFDRNKNSYRHIASGLIYYANSAMNEAQIGQGLLFEDSVRNKGQILSEAIRVTESTGDTSNIAEPVSTSFYEKIITTGKATPNIPVNQNTFNTFLAITGPEGTLTYLKKRRKFLKASKAKNAQSELDRIGYFIDKLNSDFEDELKKPSTTQITTRDLRQAKREGKAEGIQQGTTQQLEKQQKALERRDARRDRLIEALKLRSEERLQKQKEKTAQVREQAAEQLKEQKAQDKQELQEAVAESERKDTIKHRKDIFREIRASYKAGLAEGQAVMKEKGQEKLGRLAQRHQKKITRLQQRIQNLKDSKQLINDKRKTKSTLRRILRMGRSKNISYSALQQIKDIISRFNYDTIDEQEAERRELLKDFISMEDNEGERYTDMKEFAEEYDITPEEIDQFLNEIRIPDMTLADVSELFEQVNGIFQQGKREFAVWKEEQQQKISDMRALLEGDVLANSKPPKAGTPRGRKDLVRQYKLGKAGELMDNFVVSSMSSGRFLERLGENFRRIFDDEFGRLRGQAYDQIFRRIENVLGQIKKLGISIHDLARTAKNVNNESFSWSEVMMIYAGMKNRFSRNAILYGMFINNSAYRQKLYNTEDEAMAVINELLNFINQPKNAKYKQAAEIIMQDFEDNFDRINQAQIRDFNIGMDKQENYTPIFRARHQTSAGFLMNEESEQLAANASTQRQFMQRVENGFTKQRMEIDPDKQEPINTDLFLNYATAVINEEFNAALGGYARDVITAFTQKGGENGSVMEMIYQRIGENSMRVLRNIYNNSISDKGTSEAEAASNIGQIANWLMKTRSYAYIAFNLASRLFQTTSFFIPLGYNNRGHLFRSLADYMGKLTSGRHAEFMESVFQLYPELRYSSDDPDIALYQRYKQFEGSTISTTLDSWAYKGVAELDRVTKAIVFDAVYRSRLDDGMSQDDAVRLAIRAVQDTQPASSRREMGDYFRSGGMTKLVFMQFMNTLAPIYNVGVVDVARAIADPNMNKIKQAAFGVIGVAMSLGMTGLIRDGLNGKFPTGEELPDGSSDNWWDWGVDTIVQNWLNAVPILNSGLVQLYDWYRGNKRIPRGENRVLEPFYAAGKAVKGLFDDDEETGIDWDALAKAAALLGIKIPYSGGKQALRWMFGIGDKPSD